MTPKFEAVDSSSIEAVAHDPETSILSVRFKGGAIYHYEGVDTKEHQALLSAPSIGGHFHQHLRHRTNRRA